MSMCLSDCSVYVVTTGGDYLSDNYMYVTRRCIGEITALPQTFASMWIVL